jgi:erythritol transport system ATP-binding protein
MNEVAEDVILEARAITKRYPGTLALDAVTMRVYRNQVNVLIGENGAGKSTLMRILAGVETADGGELLLEGELIRIRSPREAASLGISIVHQELSVLPNLDISENVFAGREPVRAAVLLDRPTEDARSARALTSLRKPMQVRTKTAQLSLGCRQIVEVARTLDQGARVLILDEPTSALSSIETDSLFQVIQDLKRSGVTIIYISHRLHELLHLGDWFTVLRSGRIVGHAPRIEVSRNWIVERMSGRAVSETADDRPSLVDAPILLAANEITLGTSGADEASQALLHAVTFTLRRGEILGIYGLLGAGRTELLESLAGARRLLGGSILVNGIQAHISTVSDAVKRGIVLVPEDRQRDGLIPDLSIRENIAIGSMRGIWLSRADQMAHVRRLTKELNIVARDLELPVTSLSGGNQQKVIIARCLMRNPALLLLDEPTRGVDVGAKAEIYTILRRLAAKGIGILFTSSEIEETRALADRALVLCQGRISAEFSRNEITDEALFAAASPVVNTAPIPSSGVQFA